MATGFDVSKFISPFRGDMMSGFSQATDVQQAGMGRRAAAVQAELSRRAEMKRRKLAEEEALRRSLLAQSGMDRRTGARMGFEADQADLRHQRTLEQQQVKSGAEIAGEAQDALARGDTGALEQLRARARILDPMMRMTLPGDAPERVDPNVFSVNEVYPLEGGAFTMERGGETLLDLGMAAERQRQMDITGSMLAPLQNSPSAAAYAPAFEAGMEVAGRGMRGDEAGKYAMAQANKEADRLAAMERAETISGHRSTGQTLQIEKFKHQATTQIVQNVVNNEKLKNEMESVASLEGTKELLASDAGLAQKIGAWKQIRSVMSGVLSNQDINQYFGGAGKFNQWMQQINNYTDEGRIPPGFLDQALHAVDIVQRVGKQRIMSAGRAARDQVYSSPGIPFSSPEEMVRFGNQAYSAITHEPMTEEEMRAEVRRVRKEYAGRFGGGPAAVTTGTRESSSFQLDGDISLDPMDRLPVTGPRRSKVPPIPKGPQGGGSDDDEALRLLRALEGGE